VYCIIHTFELAETTLSYLITKEWFKYPYTMSSQQQQGLSFFWILQYSVEKDLLDAKDDKIKFGYWCKKIVE